MTNTRCVFQNPDMSFLSKLFAFCGLIFLLLLAARLLQSFVRGIYTNFVGVLLGHNVNFKKFKGQWAVVTGSTDGIGKAYAEQLAAKGLNIVLISRTLSKLEEVAATIQSKYKVETKVVAVDFCTSERGIYDVIRQNIADLSIAVLVNNVGLSYPYPEYYSLIPDGDKYLDNMIEANCTAATLLMRMVLPSMMEKRRGVVINISSISAMYPLPLLSVYAGTKAYIDFLSQATAVEYAPFGIYVQSVKPAFVSTKLSKIRKASLMVPTPETYVKSALLTVGLEDATYGYLPHKIRGYAQELLVAIMPMRCLCKLSLRMMNVTRLARYRKDKTEDPLKKIKAH